MIDKSVIKEWFPLVSCISVICFVALNITDQQCSPVLFNLWGGTPWCEWKTPVVWNLLCRLSAMIVQWVWRLYRPSVTLVGCVNEILVGRVRNVFINVEKHWGSQFSKFARIMLVYFHFCCRTYVLASHVGVYQYSKIVFILPSLQFYTDDTTKVKLVLKEYLTKEMLPQRRTRHYHVSWVYNMFGLLTRIFNSCSNKR